VEAQRPESGDELLDALRAAAVEVDPVPSEVRRRIHAAFVLSSLEARLSGAVGGLGRPPATPTPD
jgi:hypothetical protein